MSHLLVKRLVEAVEGRDADRFAASFAEDAVGHHPLSPEPVRGRAAIREMEQELFAAFTDVRVEVRSVLSSGDRCAVEVVLRAVNTGPLDLGGEEPVAATGRRIELPASWWYDLGPDGLVAEARDYFDTASLMSQLGLAEAVPASP